MDTFENKPLTPGNSSDLQAQVESLRHLLISVMVLVIVLSGTLNIYLLRQYRSASQDVKNIRPQVAQMAAEYQKVSGPVISDFEKKLSDFARSNQDFAQFLAQNGLKLAPANAGPTSAAPVAPRK